MEATQPTNTESTQPTNTVNQPQVTPFVSRKGKRWSVEEDTSLLERLNTMSFEDIALIHQRTVGAITMRVLMHAVKAVQDGMSLEDASVHYLLPVERITQGIPNPAKSHKQPTPTEAPTLVPNVTTPVKHANKGKRWTQDEDIKLLNMLNTEIEIEEIATAHQRNIPSIKRRIFTLAHNNGMPLEEACVYRVPAENITKRMTNQPVVHRTTTPIVTVPTIPTIPTIPTDTTNTQVLIEIRDLLRVLVTHLTKD